ncbi:MAG: hypothetical protein O2895_00905 [Chloroflexi bacterium]|nr:hypothetical protein [Chloroflexota bacterium]
MPAAWLPGPDDWPDWSLVDGDLLAHARDERPFLEAAAGLVVEFGELSALLVRAQPLPHGPAAGGAAAGGVTSDGTVEDSAAGDGAAGEAAARAAWLRNDAVLRGLAVRIGKLTRRLAAETYEGRGELQLLLDREIFTSTAALAYLLRGRPERFEAFVRDGLRADRDVWQHLDNNREARGGDNLPQEQRMRERLARSFEIAGIEPNELDLDAPSDWPEVGAQLEAIGEPEAQRMHQLGADAVHGVWNELVTHHLRADPGGPDDRAGAGGSLEGGARLGPKLEWSPARVQPLTAVAIQGSRVMAAYARHLGRDVAEAFRDKYLDLAGRAAMTDRLHEEYLERADITPLLFDPDDGPSS